MIGRRSLLAALAGGSFGSVGLSSTGPRFQGGLGVYLGAGSVGRDRIKDFESWLGLPIFGVLDFISYDSWKDILSSASWISNRWAGFDRRLTITIPMLPRVGASLKAGVQGQYDDVFLWIGKKLVSVGLDSAVVRIGHEFNGSWYPWQAHKGPELWAHYWRRIASLFKSVPMSNFALEWSPNSGFTTMRPELAWPGEDFVDLIGLSVYNDCLARCEGQTPEQRWEKHLTGIAGLLWHKEFSTSKKKPMTYPEWGTGKRPNGDGGGDDPYFIHNMLNWTNSHAIYHNYFDYNAKDYAARLSTEQFPLAGREFRRLNHRLVDAAKKLHRR